VIQIQTQSKDFKKKRMDTLERQLHHTRVADFLESCNHAVYIEQMGTYKCLFKDQFFDYDELNLSEEETSQRMQLENIKGFGLKNEAGMYLNLLNFLYDVSPSCEALGYYRLSAFFEPFTKMVIVYCFFSPGLPFPLVPLVPVSSGSESPHGLLLDVESCTEDAQDALLMMSSPA
jgi:hypothetical protein